MKNTKYGKRREGRLTPMRAKAQDTRTNPNSWETHLVRKRWDIGLLRALSLRIMMMTSIAYAKSARLYLQQMKSLESTMSVNEYSQFTDKGYILYCAKNRSFLEWKLYRSNH